jgi:hypothetical protein
MHLVISGVHFGTSVVSVHEFSSRRFDAMDQRCNEIDTGNTQTASLGRRRFVTFLDRSLFPHN